MKISEMIKRLEELKCEHGDVEVMIDNSPDGFESVEVDYHNYADVVEVY